VYQLGIKKLGVSSFLAIVTSLIMFYHYPETPIFIYVVHAALAIIASALLI
jgi:hypothetical protein